MSTWFGGGDLKRLFFALWPDERTRQQIDAINECITLTNVRKLNPQNLHMTLLYLGQVNPAIEQEITLKVMKVRCAPFAFQLDQIQYWTTPKIICLTVSQQPKALLDLVNQLVEVCQSYPIHIHDRPYQAHVTLMRKAKQVYPLVYEPIHWQADSFVLVESISTATGIRYEILKRWSLSMT